MKNSKHMEPQAWWDSLSEGERRLIWSVMRVLRSAKCSQAADVARAAAKWEKGIGCFIKVRLMQSCRRCRGQGEMPSEKLKLKKGERQ